MRNLLRVLRHSVVALAALLGLLVAAVSGLPILHPWINALSGPWTEAQGDVLVVLGSEVSPDHIVGLKTYWRCVYAVLAWRQGKFKQVVLSGGAGVSEAMRDFLISNGIPPRSIILENRSMSTRENALFVTRILGRSPGRVVLLTSDFHMFRAFRAFQKLGLAVLPRPFPDAGKNANSIPMRWPVFLALTEEMGKIAGYWVRGWI